MWRDPLDELIEGIERTLPPSVEPLGLGGGDTLVGCQLFGAAVLSGNEKEIERVEQDWRVKAWFAELKKVRDQSDDKDSRSRSAKESHGD
jgi:hypothetical protein